MQLDVESLRSFLAVAETGGITKASEILPLSQSAVSWKIKRLEERVGRDLFVREGRDFRLTRDGRTLFDYATNIVATHDEAVARLRSSDLSGNVRLGATEEITASRLAAVLGRFNRVHPGVTLEFHVGPSAKLSRMVSRNELDIAVIQIESHALTNDDGLLWTNELIWVSSAEWTYESGEVPLIAFGDTGLYKPHAERLLKLAGINYRIAFNGPSSASVRAAVEVGLGVAMLAKRPELTNNPAIVEWPRAVELSDPPTTLHVIRSAPGPRSVIAEALSHDIREELKQL